MKNVSFNMEPLLRRWKLLALKYKREATAIHEKITEIIVGMPKEEIRKLDLGNIVLFPSHFNYISDSILTKYETIVLDAHDTIEDVISGILNDEDEETEIMETEKADEEEENEIMKSESCADSNE